MKKILTITSLILVAVILSSIMCSCGGADKAIIGTWKSDIDTLTFKSNGTVIETDEYESETFSFSASNGKIKITSVRDGERMTENGTYSISGDTLTLTFENWNGGNSVIYKKV